jgi:hypothetical protein
MNNGLLQVRGVCCKFAASDMEGTLKAPGARRRRRRRFND